MEVTIVIPAYNEKACIRQVLEALTASVTAGKAEARLLVVDDGSLDGTAETAAGVAGVQVIRHPYNKGYGAAIKTGIAAAETEWCITYDADGQHTPDLIDPLLAACADGVDMVVGKREGYKGPLIRQPGKRLIAWVAARLTGRKIPDLNSGLRAFRRTQFLRYMHLFPSGFSLSTTSTVCFFKENLTVLYVPIRILKRTGKSTVRPSDAVKTLMLVFRLIMLFSPLRIFLPVSALFALLAVVDIAYEVAVTGKPSNTSAVALITLASLTFFFGLLADQVAALRREIGGRSA